MQEAFIYVFYTEDYALKIVWVNDYPRIWVSQGAREEWSLQLF